MSLNQQEKNELVRLLEKVKNTEITGEVWHQLVKKFITVPIELCVLDDENNFLMIYRKDREFDGYHLPGSVVNEWETVSEALARLIKKEIVDDLGINVDGVEPIGWLDSPKDVWPSDPSTRHGVLLLHIARFHGIFLPREGVGFYSFETVPENTLGCHKFIIPFFERFLKNKEPILGK